MSDVALPIPATSLSPIRDDHAWAFPDVNGYRIHVRLRVWPTTDGGHLVVATDLELGAGLINAAESLVRAATREFSEPLTVVRHYPAQTLPAPGPDAFDVLELDERGRARTRRCTAEILDLLGPSLAGFPGDSPAGPVNATADVIPPQSVQLARILAAALRLTQTRVVERQSNGFPLRYGPVARKDLDPISQLRLVVPALQRLTRFAGDIDLDGAQTSLGAQREKKLAKITDKLYDQAWELTRLCDALIAEERERKG
ncbi:hypothetical protein [Streptomyces niveus]|uniref:hypothetical protein n=1 Tax=Streptomyces niveus TaxID=193462 RepID=UPI00343EEA5B